MSDQDQLEPVTAKRAEGLPQFLAAAWDAFGDPQLAKEMPTTSGLPFIPELERGSGLTDDVYKQRHAAVNKAFESFVQIHCKVAALVAKSKAESAEGKRAINVVIDYLSAQASKWPETNNETEHIMNYLTEGYRQGESVLRFAMGAQGQNAAEIDAQRREMARDRRGLEQLGNTRATNNHAKDQQRVATNDAAIDADLTRRHRLRQGSDNDRSLQDQLRRIEGALDRRDRRSAQDRPAAVAPQNANGLASDPLSQMLRSQLGGLGGFGGLGSQLAGGNRFDAARYDQLRDRNDALREREARLREERREWERERQREGLERRNGAPPPLVAAAANPPPPPPPPQLNASGHPTAQPAKEDSAAQGGPPARTAGEDGKVPYAFPDGREQRAWPAVAQALDVALADNAGTNAQAAYENSPAKWDDDKDIGKRIDPNGLMTGDVYASEQAEAIVVVWGSPDSGGTLELVVNGKLVPFDPESKAFEALGPFVGWFHPNIDQGSTGGVAPAAIASAAPDHQVVPAPA